MFNWKRLHKEERGQTALETAIILIAFVVVAAVFAFTILSAGNASTEKGKKAIASGLENVQSSMDIKGAVIATSEAGDSVEKVVFTVALVAGGTPVDFSNVGDGTGKNAVVIGYRDAKQMINDVTWDVKFVGQNNGDKLLDAGELAEITVDLSATTPALDPALGINTQFTIEVKPPSGAVLGITRTTPPAITSVMELQ
jgi:flagellin FlaB